jgi:hypothetical protein
VRQGIAAFQREWARYWVTAEGKLSPLGQAPWLLRPLLLRKLVDPTPLEASLFGAWAHDENQGSRRAEAIADTRLRDRLAYLTPDQLRALPMGELYWPAGLAAQIDPEAGQLISAATAGELSWESLAGELDTGAFEIGASRGVDVDTEATLRTTRRNRRGLGAVFGMVAGAAVHELVLRPATTPGVIRLDFLELRCHVQGHAEPVLVTLDHPEHFAAVRRENLFVLNANVFVAHSTGGALYLDLQERIPGTVFRVDVECGFAAIATGQLLPTPGRLRSVEEAGHEVERLERLVGAMQRSLSWRITRPLRMLKRRGGP